MVISSQKPGCLLADVNIDLRIIGEGLNSNVVLIKAARTMQPAFMLQRELDDPVVGGGALLHKRQGVGYAIHVVFQQVEELTGKVAVKVRV